MKHSNRIATIIGRFRKKNGELKANREANFEFHAEVLEPRMMLNGDIGGLVFEANFEDVDVEDNGFAFFQQVSGLTATNNFVEVQNNHPSVGPASEGSQHLELDGVNGVFVELVSENAQSLLLSVDYSARPGVDASQNTIEILWNGNVVETLSLDGEGQRSTDFQEFEIELTGGVGRLEFRSNTPDDEFGLGGLIDNVRVYEQLSPLALAEIADQNVGLGSQLNLTASLLPPNENLDDITYSLSGAPAGLTIDSQTGEIFWTATQENIDNSPSEPDQTIVGDPLLEFQSSFEDVDVESGGFGFFSATSGFQGTNGPVEIQDNHSSVGAPSDGSQHLELDGINGIFRDVNTTEGERYELVFDYSPRPGVDAQQNAIEIWWSGQLLDTVTRDGQDQRGTDFQELRYDLSNFSGDLTRLEFRSNDPGDTVGLGGLIDNVRVFSQTVEVIEGQSGKYNVTAVSYTHLTLPTIYSV